jgi:hypothetical protein
MKAQYESSNSLTAGVRRTIQQSVLLALAAWAAPAIADDNRAPVLTGVETNIVVQTGNKVHFHAYAIGVQIYHWNATLGTWGTSTPSAILYDGDGNEVAIHYAGPTWESNSGSKVVGVKVNGVTVDPTAIPWLLLKAKTAEGPGIFARTTYVQRVNTTGGLAPSTPGTVDGEEADVPYTAEYFFYRAQ